MILILFSNAYTVEAGQAELSTAFDKLWQTIWDKRILNIAATKEVARLYEIGGPEWFVNVLVDKIRSQVWPAGGGGSFICV